MFRNYFKTALRNLLRYKGFSIINIISLSIAITGCLVIGLFVWDEGQYDRFVKDGDRVYRFFTKRVDNSSPTTTASVSPMFATHAEQEFPEVDATARILMYSDKMLFEANEIKTYEDKGIIADASFFKVFPLDFLKGDASTALADRSSVVITDVLARKYFGSLDVMGKTIRIDTTAFLVSGVMSKPGEHFHLNIDFVLPMAAAAIPDERMKRWQWQQFFTYVKLKAGSNVSTFEKKFQESVKKQAEPITSQSGFTYIPFLQPLKDIHLHSSEFVYDNAKRGNSVYVKGLTIIAIFVLIIACFNFINLATARSFRRAKEIGVRKVVGAERGQLVFQYTAETVLLSLAAFIVAVLATVLLLPLVNNFTDKAIVFDLSDPILIIMMLSGAILIGVLAGIYPALVMSGFKPIKVLKGLKSGEGASRSSTMMRQALVIVQFALSALLIVCTTIVYRQINFLHKKDLGFNKDQVVYFAVHGEVETKAEAFKTELLRSGSIVSATAGYGLPGDALAGDAVRVVGKDGDKEQPVNLFVVDHDYINTMGLEMASGRDFSRQFASDVNEAFIINETAVKELGFGTAENALGKELSWEKWMPDSLQPIKTGKIIGIVKDFHYKSLHEKVNSAVLQIYPQVVAKVAVKLKAADVGSSLAYIKTVWNKFSPEYPLDYNFLDENFQKMYKAEDRLSGLLWIFTCMAIFVGCIGLFGLAAFNAEQRVKEIGIRKVLGATAMSIMAMLSKSFLRPVLIASILAFPIAWWAMNKWLQEFPYRVNISWWVFAIAGFAALVIALITVSFQAIKASVANPVKSLRSE